MIDHGGIYIDHSFLDQNTFINLDEKFYTYNFEATYQPSGIDYGNRLQAYPTYETDFLSTIDKDLDTLIKTKVESIVGFQAHNWHASLRYIVSDEIKQSKQYARYGMKHADATNYAGVLYFEQAVDGGTAFFRTPLDIVPDMEIGALPNRCIIYRGDINHAPAHDFTYDKRKCLIFFFNQG